MSRSDIPTELRYEWFLCGDVPENFWDALARDSGDIGFHLSAFMTTDRTGYACVTLQIERSQVHFIMPLGGKKIAWFLKEAGVCGMRLALSRNQGTQVQVKKFGVAAAHVAPVLDIASRCRDLTGTELLHDLGLAVRELRFTPAIASVFDGVPVPDEHVVAVLLH